MVQTRTGKSTSTPSRNQAPQNSTPKVVYTGRGEVFSPFDYASDEFEDHSYCEDSTEGDKESKSEK